jgi:uncharacterized protein with FMN-binding domain
VATVAAIVLLASFRTPDQAPPRIAAVPRGTLSTPAPSAPPTAPPAGTAPAAASGVHDGTWTGADEFAGNYGDVQVQLVVRGGRITDVVAVTMPTDRRRSAQISQDAGPQLHDEVLQAQGATIDTVSGATYTSDAYAQSVQAALDRARA